MKWYQKNIFKETIKGVDPGTVKKKYQKAWFILAFLGISIFIALYLICRYYQVNVKFLAAYLSFLLALFLFLKAYFSFKYKMLGDIAIFPEISGRFVPYLGYIFLISGLTFIIFAVLFLIK